MFPPFLFQGRNMNISFNSDDDVISINTMISSLNYYPPITYTPKTYTSTFTDAWFIPQKTTPFIDGFPEWGDFEKMRNEYPALNTAFENLKMVHKLCEAEWEGKKKEND